MPTPPSSSTSSTSSAPSTAAPHVPAMLPSTVVLILSLSLGLQPVTTDLYLPALPALSEGLAAGVSQTQLTLSALLLAFGISQLIWGPLSDRFGRRPIMLTGFAAYTLRRQVVPRPRRLKCWWCGVRCKAWPWVRV